MNLIDKLTFSNAWHSVLRQVLILSFLVATGLLFVYLNHVQPYYFIDEVFHIPQTQRYCQGKFFEWDNKITTLPGLYLITTVLLAPLGLCGTAWIRSTNLVATFLNLYLVHEILKTMQETKQRQQQKDAWMRLITSLNIVLFPPLYFWFFLYYTDVVSTNAVLLMLLLHLRGYFRTSAVIGALAILVRQVNVIWVVLVTLDRALDLLESRAHSRIPRRDLNTPRHVKWLWDNVMGEMQRGVFSFVKFVMEICVALCPYIIVGLAFTAFVVWNEGIVVGDRSAHVATVHLPQMFYFSAFTFCFAWPYMLPHWKTYFRCIQKHWVLTSCIFGLMTIIVHRNTLVHPYVLADNRHYVFYVWNRFLGRYMLLRYLLIPVYGFTMFSIMCCVKHMRFVSQVGYLWAVAMVLVPQLLLEPRYFLIPYLLFRLNIQKPQPWQVLMELATALIVNGVQFFIFVNKVIYWSDQENPQRMSW